jgi:hypothetical protein
VLAAAKGWPLERELRIPEARIELLGQLRSRPTKVVTL